MKRPLQGKITKIKKLVESYHYEIECPHCHSLFRYYGMAVDLENLMMVKCSNCKNPIDFRPPRPKKKD